MVVWECGSEAEIEVCVGVGVEAWWYWGVGMWGVQGCVGGVGVGVWVKAESRDCRVWAY